MSLDRWTSAGLLVLALQLGAGAAPRVELGSATGDAGTRLVEVTFDAPEFLPGEFGQGYQVALAGAGWIGRPGAPDLPSVQQLFEMSDRSGVALRLVEGDWELLPELPVEPCQERLANQAENPLPWLRDHELYATNAFWPEQVWELGEPALMRNTRVAKASFFPVQVNPVTGEARVWTRMVFELSFPGVDLRNARTYELPARVGGLDRMLGTQVVRTQGDEALRDMLFDRGPLPGKYLVFAKNAALATPGLTALLDWKRKKGHPVVVVTESNITFTTTAIRSRITTEYQSADPVAYVLLVGDVDGDYSLPTDGGTYDHHYAMIEGGDILGDVAVGRLSAGNATQLNTICYKILQYESTPYVENDSWLRRAGLTVGSSVCAMSMKQLSRNIAAELVERRGYNNIDSAFCSGSSHVTDWFEEGLSFYSYRGWVGMEGLSATDVQNLAQGPRTGVATIFTCGTGDFNSGDDYTEAFLQAGNVSTPGGAVAAMGFATLSTHTRYNNVVVGGYYGALLEYDVPEVGACLLQGKYELYRTLPPGEQSNAANFAYWGNLMGDPGTCQWAGSLAPLSWSVPGILLSGTSHLELTVTSGGQPVEGVVVCAYQDLATDLQVRAISDADGHVLLPLAGLQTGSLWLTATHRRHVPLQSGLSVTSGAANPALAGLNAGIGLLPNETLQPVSFTVTNAGSAALTGINVTPTLNPGFGTLTHSGLSLASLAPGASQVFTGLQVAPAAGLASGTQLPVMLELASAQGTFTLLAQVPVAAPAFTPGTVTYPHGALEPGASATVRFPITNSGAVAASGLTVSFTPLMANSLAPPVAVFVGNAAPGATVNVEGTFAALPGVNRGQPVPVRLDWISHAGAVAGSAVAMVTVGGTLSNLDPTGPDAYGYWAYDSGDNSPLAPTYSWRAISTPEGGPGTEVLLNDDGNEQDAGRWINLPFPFTYYGVTYTRAAVCSNGFLTFDEGGFGEWDFRNHIFPSPMGPDAMIAPMWDDHLTTGTTRGVWTWHDTAAHVFVVSWYNLTLNSSGGVNSFQLLLYDPVHYPTQTGDGPFQFQYLSFSDTQSAGADFPYCSIGFKDHTSNQGLTIRHWTQQAATAQTVQAGRAIYISTPAGPVNDTNPPSIVLAGQGTVFTGEPVTVSATITDYSGVASATLSWRLNEGAWNEDAMNASGAVYSATIPGQPNATQVEYFVTAVDASENVNVAVSATVAFQVYALLFADGFNGASSFTHEAGGGLTDEWHLEDARAFEGSHSWKFGGSDTLNYSNNAGGVLSSPVMSIPAGSSQIRASLQHWVRAETSPSYPDSCYDGGLIQWRLNGGDWVDAVHAPALTHSLRGTSVTAALRAWLGFPRRMFSGIGSGWTPITLDIPAGTTSLQLRWLFGTDTGTQREGWYVDDFRLTALLPAGLLPAVTDLSISASSNQVFLDWSPVAGAVAYRVYESSTWGEEPVLLGETTSTDWQVSQMGTRKFYTVTAVH